MRFRLARLLGVAASCLGAALLAPAPAGAQASDTLVAAQASDVLTLDPSADTSPISLNVFKNIYDQLTDIAADGTVSPLLATAWEVSADSSSWTFTVRSGAKFHDGTPVTADDVVWSYRMVMGQPKSPVRSYLQKIKSIEKVAPDKVRFTLIEPFAPFDRQVSLISIMPQKAYEQMGAAKFANEPVGSGPFKVVRWVKDDRVELEAFQDYWGGAPKIRKLVFRPVPSETARTAALLSGELDVVPVLPPSLVERLSARKGVRIVKIASNKVLYLGFDVNNPVLKSVALRRAADYAIDRKAITEKLLLGLGKPSGQIVAPVSFGYDPSIEPTPYDANRARELVRQSGYKGERILFQYPNNSLAFGDRIAQAVASYLDAAGIKVELQGMEYSAFIPLWLGRKLNGMHMFAYAPSILDAELPLQSLYETGRSRGYWFDPRVDDLIRRQRSQTDPAKRKALIGEIWRISKEEVPYVILHNEIQAYGIRDDVNWNPRPDERLPFHNASRTRGR